MAALTYYVVLPFSALEGDLMPGEAIEAPNSGAALRMADRLAASHGGAIAFKRTGDSATGDFEPAEVIGRFGDVPRDEDLPEFTG